MSETASKRKKGLGRGLEVLLGSTPDFSVESSPSSLPISRLRAGKYQPRTRMDEGALNELAQSIREQGVMQPILVRPADGDTDGKVYEIIVIPDRIQCGFQATFTIFNIDHFDFSPGQVPVGRQHHIMICR